MSASVEALPGEKDQSKKVDPCEYSYLEPKVVVKKGLWGCGSLNGDNCSYKVAEGCPAVNGTLSSCAKRNLPAGEGESSCECRCQLPCPSDQVRVYSCICMPGDTAEQSGTIQKAELISSRESRTGACSPTGGKEGEKTGAWYCVASCYSPDCVSEDAKDSTPFILGFQWVQCEAWECHSHHDRCFRMVPSSRP